MSRVPGAVVLAGERRGAEVSTDGRFRYRLWREWGPAHAPRVLWIMLNPSTADAAGDDPTVRKCRGFAKRWGYHGLEIVNLFPLRATSPAALRDAAWLRFGASGDGAAVMARNYDAIAAAAGAAGRIVAAWGNHAAGTDGPRVVRERLAEHTLYRLGAVTAAGEPRHPLHVPYAISVVAHQIRQCDVPGCGIARRHTHCPECGGTDHGAAYCDNGG